MDFRIQSSSAHFMSATTVARANSSLRFMINRSKLRNPFANSISNVLRSVNDLKVNVLH